MKRILLFIFIGTITAVSYSQNSPEFFKTIPVINNTTPEWAVLMYSDNPNVGAVEDLYRDYYKQHEFVKTVHTQNHKHWLKLVEPLLDQNSYIKQLSEQEESAKYQQLKDNYSTQQALRIPGSNLGWVAMGPFETFDTNNAMPISWHKNVYAIDQSLSHPDILICGTEAGGVYKSIDKGSNWTLISIGEVFSGGNAAVKIHPTNPNNFLVASNRRIYQSLDGGGTWTERFYTNGTGHEFEYSPLNNNIIFHASSTGLFKSTDAGQNWTQIYTETCWDIDFHPTDNNVVYLLKTNATAKRSELFRSDNNGLNWTLKDTGWYVPTDLATASDSGGKIAVTPASEDLVYVCLIGASKDGDQGWIGVYKSTDKGDNWNNPSGQDGAPFGAINSTDNWNVAAYSGGYHQGFYNFDMEASAQDADKIWIATIRLTESSDGGQTFQSIGAANSTRLSNVHADVQDIEVIGNDIWVASDGGINYSDDELTSHVALNKGIQAAHFWGFNTGWNEDTFTGGKYHDGTSGWYENYGLGNAYNIGGVEEASGYVHPIESRKLMYRTHYASDNTSVKTIPDVLGNPVVSHPSLPIRPNESYNSAERSGVYFDPRYADHMYVGLQNTIYKSTDGGNGFDVLYTFPDANGLIYEMEISRSNPDVMYAVYNKLGGYWDTCEIWKTTNGGQSWNKTTTDPTGNRRRFRISVHPEDADKVWICTPRGIDGERVHYTDDGGATWQNKTTTTLNGEGVEDILYQGGSNDVVYVATRNGVFYWDVNSNDWINYSTDLPLVTKSLQINPFYRDAELRLASNGRGVWGRDMQDTDFYPIAQPITYTNLIKCVGEVVTFDCYSILNHDGASWEWTISPEPESISSNTVRNPEVVFGTEGLYDITLTVTDGNGNSSSKTITSMITVVDDCPPCESSGNMSWNTAVTLVDFNNISNATGKTQAYTDYSESIATDVEIGNTYELKVNLNTDGNYTVRATAWIDWNKDSDFEDANEAYDLGFATNTADGSTNLSPISIEIPMDAEIGETTLRVSAKYNTYPSLCETGFDGEVEDYAINVGYDGLLYTQTNWIPNAPTNATGSVNALVLNGMYALNSDIEIKDLRIINGAELNIEESGSAIIHGDLINNGKLILNSASDHYSSLIVNGSVSGDAIYKRHVNTNAGGNDLVSAPLTGQTFGDFATLNPNIFSNPTNTSEKLFGPFDKVTGAYLTYDTDIPAEAAVVLDPGVGYRTASSDDSTFEFKGTVNTGTVTINILHTANDFPEWNLIGNPYPSYIKLSDFLNTNIAEFLPSSGAIYGYDGNASDGWTIWNLAYSLANPNAIIAPGQGFLVSSKIGGGTMVFNPTMRTTATGDTNLDDDFIEGRSSNRPNAISFLNLQVSHDSNTYKTDFYFTDNASLGLNVGYDAEVYGGTAPDFAIYSHLVEDNEGYDMAIQSVSFDDLNNNLIIPLGINADQGSTVTVEMLENTLPSNVEVYLEDTIMNTFTLLNSNNYQFTPDSNLSGTGRFFLRFESATLETGENTLNTIQVFATTSSKAVIVKGLLTSDADITLIDAQGRKVLEKTIKSNINRHVIDVSNLSSGLYIVQLKSNTQNLTQKVIIK